ncbi:MAG: DUF4388 domain-containing protein [Myxococcaceae bacterium]
MFTPRREVVRAKSGTLHETPLPLLLHALLSEERSCTLELKLRNLEKRVHFENGVPVGCESNLLHETFGKALVAKGKLTDEQLHALNAESAAVGKPLQLLVVEKKLINSFELFKLLQQNLAHTLLDAFRWVEAKWKLVDLDEVLTPIKMNTAQLVYLGAAQLPVELLDAHFKLPDDQVLALLVDDVSEELKLPAKDLRLVQALKKRPTVATVLSLPNTQRDDLRRKLYALCVLELVDDAKVADARPKRSSPSGLTQLPVEPIPAPAASPPVAAPKPVDDEALLSALATEFLAYRSKDAFDLLAVTPETPIASLSTAFLAKANALSPAKFHHPDARNRAEQLLLAYARAYGALVEPEQHALHRKRRENALAKKKGGPDPSRAAEHFKIRTELLDAKSQFDEGKKRLEQGQVKSAVEHFEYAADIEPTGRTLAWLALARFRLNPDFAAEKSLEALADACARDPQCEDAWAFRADLALSLSRRDEAIEAYRHASRLNPAQGRYQNALRGLGGKR